MPYKIHCRPNWTHHCTTLAHSHALTLQNYTKLLAMKLFYQIYTNYFPPIVNSLIPDWKKRQTHTTRSVTRDLIRTPAYKNSFGRNSFIRASVLIWNELPLQIRTATSVAQFEKLYTNFLTTNQSCLISPLVDL